MLKINFKKLKELFLGNKGEVNLTKPIVDDTKVVEEDKGLVDEETLVKPEEIDFDDLTGDIDVFYIDSAIDNKDSKVTIDELLNGFSKGELSDFLSRDKSGNIIRLLDSNGIDALKESNNSLDVINYILEFSPYREEVFNNEYFIKSLFEISQKKHYNYFQTINRLSEKTISKLIEYGLSHNVSYSNISNILVGTSKEFQKEFFSRDDIPRELVCTCFNRCNLEVIVDTLNRRNIVLSELGDNALNIIISVLDRCLIRDEDGNVSLNSKMVVDSCLIDDKFLNDIWNNNSIVKLREMVNKLSYFMNTDKVEDFIRNKELEAINGIKSASNSTGLIEPFNSYYLYTKEIEETDNYDLFNSKEYIECKRKMYEVLDCDYPYEEFFYDEGLLDRLRKYSNVLLSDYIVDIIFQDNFYDIKANIKELLKAVNSNQLSISDNNLFLYNRLLEIDTLSNEDKVELFEDLKEFNMQEEFYDDMALARRKRNESIKNSSLNSNDLDRFYNEELSNKYGVKVYVVDDRNKTFLVKSGAQKNHQQVGLHSYSLTGKNDLKTFGDSDSGNTFVYDSNILNPDQIIHVSETDASTSYLQGIISDISYNINRLASAKDLCKISSSYNEVSILETGSVQTDMSKDLPVQQKLGVYAVNEINERHVAQAKQTNLPIIFVSENVYGSHDFSDSVSRDEYLNILTDLNSRVLERANNSYKTSNEEVGKKAIV